MKTFLLVCLVLLAGCETGVKIPERREVPVAQACVDEASRPARLQLRGDAEILELDDYKVIQALRADRGRAFEQLDKLEAIVERCSRVSGPPFSSSLGGVRE